MHLAMGVPLSVATATSNMMIGITATSSRGHLPAPRRDRPVCRRARPRSACSSGRCVGTRIAHRVDIRVLRVLFVVVLAYTAYEMARKALGL